MDNRSLRTATSPALMDLSLDHSMIDSLIPASHSTAHRYIIDCCTSSKADVAQALAKASGCGSSLEIYRACHHDYHEAASTRRQRFTFTCAACLQQWKQRDLHLRRLSTERDCKSPGPFPQIVTDFFYRCVHDDRPAQIGRDGIVSPDCFMKGTLVLYSGVSATVSWHNGL